MGLVLDSSVLIAAEREKRPVSQLLASLQADHAETRVIISAVTVMERSMAGAAVKRRRYLDEIFAIIPAEPFTGEMAKLAAKFDAEAKKTGRVIATADLLIGVTALYHGYSVGTRNVRHFQMLPGLS